jgi:hypothetical protein
VVRAPHGHSSTRRRSQYGNSGSGAGSSNVSGSATGSAAGCRFGCETRLLRRDRVALGHDLLLHGVSLTSASVPSPVTAYNFGASSAKCAPPPPTAVTALVHDDVRLATHASYPSIAADESIVVHDVQFTVDLHHVTGAKFFRAVAREVAHLR